MQKYIVVPQNPCILSLGPSYVGLNILIVEKYIDKKFFHTFHTLCVIMHNTILHQSALG